MATTACDIAMQCPCLRLADDRSRRESVQVEGVVLETWSAEVDEQGVGDAGGAEIVDDLRPLDLREGLYGLQLDDEPSLKASEVRSPDGRERLPVVVDAHGVLAHVRYARLPELDFQCVAIRRFEETESKYGMHAPRTSHDCVCFWIIFQDHVHIIP